MYSSLNRVDTSQDLYSNLNPLDSDSVLCHTDFYARQPYRQVLLRARISYGNSVCPSICPS